MRIVSAQPKKVVRINKLFKKFAPKLSLLTGVAITGCKEEHLQLENAWPAYLMMIIGLIAASTIGKGR